MHFQILALLCPFPLPMRNRRHQTGWTVGDADVDAVSLELDEELEAVSFALDEEPESEEVLDEPESEEVLDELESDDEVSEPAAVDERLFAPAPWSFL